MTLALTRFDSFINKLKEQYPSLQIRYKNESVFMRFLGRILFFNKNFMTDYATTIGNTIYFPSKIWVNDAPITAILIAAHEYVHIHDYHRLSPLLYVCMYLSPQLLALLALPLAFIIGWWALLMFILLAPLPSPGRTYLEQRGYDMSLFVIDYRYRELNIDAVNRTVLLIAKAKKIEQSFTGPEYYYMWPFGVFKHFANTIKYIDSGDILDSDVFRTIKKALDDTKL